MSPSADPSANLSSVEQARLAHTLSSSWADDPVKFVSDSYICDPQGDQVVLDTPQKHILSAISKHDRVAVRSCHGIGKTATAALATQWWLSTRWPSLVVTLAPYWPHLEEKLWPEINRWYSSWVMKERYECLDLELRHLAKPTFNRAVAVSSDKAANVEGFHSPNLLVIIDEARDLPEEIYASIKGALTKFGGKLLVLSTPPLTPAGWYPSIFGPKSAGWYTIHISAEQSARVSREYILEMERDFGKNSSYYQAKVLGNIPDGQAQVVISLGWILAAQTLGPRKDRKRSVVTVDVAREGEDLTVVGAIKDSKHHICYWEPQSTIPTVVAACRKWVLALDAGTLVIDDTGVGGGVTDIILMMQRQGDFPKTCTVIPAKFGSRASREDRFHSLKDELWWAAREALKQGRIALQTDDELAALKLPRGSDLKQQLLAPIYDEDVRNRIVVMDHRKGDDKRDRVKALPRKSPDLAHTFILGAKYYLAQQDSEYIKTETPYDAEKREFWERVHKAKHGEDGSEYGYSERYQHFGDRM